MMAKCDHRLGKFLTCNLLFRGDFIPRDVNGSVYHTKIKRAVRFVDWSPAGFKVGINYQTALAVPGSNLADLQRSCCMIGNSTAIKSVFAWINHRFDAMYAKRAFVHSYLQEGMEQA
jgi:tubulin alpha